MSISERERERDYVCNRERDMSVLKNYSMNGSFSLVTE